LKELDDVSLCSSSCGFVCRSTNPVFMFTNE
jgi:hypothetical protein